MNDLIQFRKVDPYSADATLLADALTQGIARRYDFQMDGKGGFTPEEVTAEKAGYLRIENYGIYKENLHSNCFEKVLL